ncbi:MAG: glycosyltransferase family 4 protein [Gemmatimonadetes bacterium]|nr:glycosyltransferase family 4 protein [Gemmatimonadota bacterium]
MSRLRLCFVVESGTDVRLVNGLAQRFDLTVLARRIAGGVEISRTPEGAAAVITGPGSRAGFARRVWGEVARRGCFDAVLAQGYGPAALAANLAARRSGISAALLVCSPVERYYAQRRHHPGPAKRYYRSEMLGLQLLARANARLARHYIVLSHHLAEVVRGHGTAARIDVIPVYGVDTAIFHPATQSKAELRKRRGLPPQGAVVFFSSRVAPEKDADTLLLAARQLLDSGRDLWLLHRSGGYRAFLESARAAGVAERVIATDAVHPVHELPLDYQTSDLLVQASREEGLGFSPLEALACGTPVVAAAVGGLRETIIEGKTGWTYPVGDAEALARQVSAALDDRNEAARRAAAGREMVKQRYERAIVFDQLEKALSLSREP